MTSLAHVVYGTVPASLAAVPPDAAQCAPLVPGNADLAGMAPESVASIAIAAPPGTLERRYVLALALRALIPDAPLTVLAPQDQGGRRIAAELKSFGCAVTETPRTHHRICTARRPLVMHGVDDALQAGGPQRHPALDLWTQPGIFSWDRIDTGTALLLKHLPPLAGTGADLGAGLGVLSMAVLNAPQVTRITLVDIDRRAVTMARRNINDTRAAFLWGDVRHDALSLSGLDFVVMNPPFHAAGVEDKALGQAFIAAAATMLKPGGTCWLTANRHLPYEGPLARAFARVTPVAEAEGFKIYRAEK